MKMLLIVASIFVAACKPIDQNRTHDQCLRATIFQQCMVALPAGPVATKYNDWDEVIAECGRQAQYLSVRNKSQVKPECKWD